MGGGGGRPVRPDGFSPLPGDEVDVVPDGRVVFGPVLRRGVAPRVLRLGRVGVREAAPAHQQADGERRERHPGSHVGHLRRRVYLQLGDVQNVFKVFKI